MTRKIPNEKIPVLDHGYVELIETWGSDERIIEAARMSTGKGFEGWGPKCQNCGEVQVVYDDGHERQCPSDKWEPGLPVEPSGHVFTVPGDEKLLAYLWKNAHHTPFEMCGAIFEVQAPIMVFREWHRHRVPFSYNEASARYAPLPDLNYVPTIERLMMNSKTNKQAGTIAGAAELTEAGARRFQSILRTTYEEAQTFYEGALKSGVPKELARIHLPVGRYSRMRTSANVRGWLAFLTLRMAPSAQWEIRQYANVVHDMLMLHFPRTLALFDEGRSD